MQVQLILSTVTALTGKTSLEKSFGVLAIITSPYPSPSCGVEEFQKCELFILNRHLEGQQ